ncbi:MAG: AAA family ATPase [Candidatus Bathyarchaeia archaeon]
MLIQEVILENFMSYEYARVPFKNGVNVICGPNGAGKSSLLLAISVGLGQSYTERSRKLSDLIRWGKDQARVTLVLNNSKHCGKRPVPKYAKDQLFLTRILRRDGKYWFELENHATTKQDVERVLGKFGIDPDNMLIIMHQNMVEQFSVLSNVEKLRMVEAAVGLEPFRENVLQAQHKLARILSQEESVNKLLESAEQTLNYWREQYEKYQEKKQLQTKRRFLERELAWAEVERRESIVRELEANMQREQQNLTHIEKESQNVVLELQAQQKQQEELKSELKSAFNEQVNIERVIARNETTIALCQQLLMETSALKQTIYEEGDKHGLKLLRRENLQELLENSHQQILKLSDKRKENQMRLQNTEEAIEKIATAILDKRIQLALMKYRREDILANLERIKASLNDAKTNLNNAITKAEQTGARIAVTKSIMQIMDELHVTDGHLAALRDVSEDIERMYESYSKLYLELKEKARLTAENRSKALEEVKVRMDTWRNVMQNLIDRVNLEYQKIMAQALAVGEVRLSNGHDIETAGLEILVGFKGGKPVTLDAYTQSGGERTTATMSFLLALQQHVRSPFRAVDEYDIHMDPKNREMIARMLLAMIKDANAQYLVITPSQVTFAQENANIITVQNVNGKSVVREVA